MIPPGMVVVSLWGREAVTRVVGVLVVVWVCIEPRSKCLRAMASYLRRRLRLGRDCVPEISYLQEPL